MKKLATLLACVAFTLPSLSFAQLGSLPGFGSKSSSNASADLGGQQDKLVRSFVAANKDVLAANSEMADALGLQTASVASKATADSLTEGATKGNLEEANKVSSTSTDAIVAELKKAPKLDAEAKKKFAGGLATLTAGVVKYVGMRSSVQDFSAGLKGASPLQLPKLQAGAYVATNFPTSVKNLGAALNSAVTFAKSNDIPVPTDATSALASL